MPRLAFSWWLYPNLLGLDSPAAAVVWQRFLGVVFQVPVSGSATLVLGLVVWSIYLADRWWDAHTGQITAERHLFAAAYPRLMAGLLGMALGGAAVGCARLSPEVVRAGLLVAVGIAGYLILVHGLRATRIVGWSVKEMLVGLGFAAGIAVPLLASDVGGRVWGSSVATFAVLCWLDCRLIECWEQGTRPGPGELLLAVSALGLCLVVPLAVGLAAGSALGLLLMVHAIWGRTRPRVARLLADAILLTPLPWLLGL